MAFFWRFIFGLFLCAACPFVSSSTLASETVTYSYDDRGRLTQVSRSGSVNDAVQANYSYDKAGNRTNVAVTGPTISVGDASVTEGGPLNFSVSRTSSNAAASVNFATSNGTASAGSDYAASSGTLNFAIGEASKSLGVSTIDDAAGEASETVTLTLFNPVGATLLDAIGVGTIVDNDAPPPCSGVSFTLASNGAVSEGTNSQFTVTKTGTAAGSCGISYATTDVSAAAGSDYVASSSSLTFATTQTSQSFTVPTIDDAIIESAESFSVALSSPTGGATLGNPGSATATISDNDSGPCAGVTFSINDQTSIEDNPLVFTVTKTGSTNSSCSISFATADGSAIAPTHYAATSGILTFTPTQTSKTVTVTTVYIGRLNGALIMYVNLSSPTAGASITDSQGQGSIQAEGGGGCPLC